MRYRIVEDDEIYNDVNEAIENCIEEDWHRDDDYFEDWVNTRYDYIEINGERYDPYDILDNMDQGNLDDLRDEYCETENENDWDNARYELEHSSIGRTVSVHDKTIEIIEDDEDEEEIEAVYVEDIEDVRARLKQESEFKVEQTIQTEKEEKDLMSMFQVVGE